MQKQTLTANFDGIYKWNGHNIEVDSSAGNVLLILDLFADEANTVRKVHCSHEFAVRRS